MDNHPQGCSIGVIGCILHGSEAFIGKASKDEVVVFFTSKPWQRSIWKPPARPKGEIWWEKKGLLSSIIIEKVSSNFMQDYTATMETL